MIKMEENKKKIKVSVFLKNTNTNNIFKNARNY